MPTVEDIHRLGQAIGISCIPVHGYYTAWWNVLHELGHYAVKTDAYINLWQRHNQSDREVPYFNWFDSSYEAWQLQQQVTILGPYNGWNIDAPDFEHHFAQAQALIQQDVLERIDSKDEDSSFQSTPGEWGVSLWCIRVLKAKGWIDPRQCEEWIASTFRNNRDLNQWKLQPHQKKVANQQLQRAGIDPLIHQFRSTKLAVSVGIAIALGEIDAIYGKDFRIISTTGNRLQIQLQHNQIASRLKASVGSQKQWQGWLDSKVFALPASLPLSCGS
jgi:hypothetical protein